MKITNRFNELEKAQILPFLVVALIVLVAFAALIVDGGSILLNRRTAQAAADAGAMAGARELCYSTGADPLEVARSYALMNGAATVNAQYDNGSVLVNTSVTNDSFFAKIFSEDSLAAGAEAAAGCFSPGGNYLLPIAWSCRPSLVDEAPFDPGLDCKMMALDWDGLLRPLVEGSTTIIEIPQNDVDLYHEYMMDGDNIVDADGDPPKQIYLIMDDIAAFEEAYCKEDLDPADSGYDVALTCDLDGDGKNDIEGGGNRGWLDLNNAGGGASDLIDWITNGLNFPVSPHTWLSGQTGVITSVYESIKDHRVGDVVLIPVFNAYCDDSDPTANTTCMDVAHAAPFPPEPSTWDIDYPGQAPKFHVTTFAPFYISCVHTFQFDDNCPGFTLAQDMNPDPKLPHKSLILDNTKSVEGYFLTNVDLELDLENPCDVNLGNCTVSLTK